MSMRLLHLRTSSHHRITVLLAIVAISCGAWYGVKRWRAAATPDLSKLTVADLQVQTDLHPTPASLTVLFKRLHDAGDNEQALKTAKRFVQLFPAEARSHNLLGIALASTNDPGGAEKEFQAAILRDSRDIDPYINIGRLALLMDDPRRAESEFDRATTVNPNSSEAWRGYAEAEEALYNQQDAIQAYKRAIKLAPGRPEAYALLGAFMAEIGSGDEAKPYLEKALAMGYKSGRLYSGLAMAYADIPVSDDDLPKALKYADEANKLGAKGTLTQYARSLALQRMGKYQEAIAGFRKVIAVSENANGPWIGIAQCYRALGKARQAEQAAAIGERIVTQAQHLGNLKYQIQTRPNRLDLREQYADLMMQNGQYLMAADQYRYVAIHTPEHPEMWLKAARAFDLGGEKDLADYVRPFAKTGHASKSATSTTPATSATKSIAKGN
jgi:tetratricopeptide (TPR) repeat protein